ncbi:MAG: PhzF family phenazine biosynthesis isomerase [Bacteroidia bacterium]|nr:PhzF family phenazine biosynthesis isomerase [Bacteroidia bacterium]
MSTPRTIYQVDAFTTEPFKGNPAGVCILNNEMPEEWMQNVSAEMNLSETSFIIPEKEVFKIRFFTPEAEIPLCGHATLSSAHILYETGITGREKEITFLSKVGELKIRSSGSWITMNFPAYGLEPIEIPDLFESIIGIRPAELYKTGHGWTFVLLNSENEVRGLKPDFKMMKYSGFGDMIVTALSSDKNFDFCVRCFAPALGIDEDPVTGSAHCALVPFWHNKTGRSEFVSHQVSKRGGVLKVALKGDRVEISGQAKTIINGQLFV